MLWMRLAVVIQGDLAFIYFTCSGNGVHCILPSFGRNLDFQACPVIADVQFHFSGDQAFPDQIQNEQLCHLTNDQFSLFKIIGL